MVTDSGFRALLIDRARSVMMRVARKASGAEKSRYVN
jgi:hypothetical protein